MNYLVVVESPTKAKKIQPYLNKNSSDHYEVLASFGHIRQIPYKGKVIDSDYQVTYEIPKDKKDVAKKLIAAAKNKDLIYLCSDPDREGEAISWHVMQVLKDAGIKKPFKRVVFHEITPHAIKEAFNHPRDLDMDLVHAQFARQILDRIVGYGISPLLMRSLKHEKSLSAGRVQSPALRLIVNRDEEIATFIPNEYWSITLNTHKGEHAFSAKLHSLRGMSSKIDIPNEIEALKIVKDCTDKPVTVTNIEQKEVKRSPKPPFTTSSLQQEANRKFKWSVSTTMQVAQDLFEQGLITYMRTDSTHLSDEAITDINKALVDLNWSEYAYGSKRVYKSKQANAQEAHEAIRTTVYQLNPTINTAKSGDKALKLFQLILRRTLASQMKDAIFDQTTVELLCGEGIFRATGTIEKYKGYRVAYEETQDESKEEEKNQNIPSLSVKESLPNDGIIPEQHSTKPPARYSEASLVHELEKKGIGRPSTYGAIIKKIKDRNYVDKARTLDSSNIGKHVSHFLEKRFPDYVDYQFTSKMEDDLDKISRGELDYIDFLRSADDKLTDAISKAKAAIQTDMNTYLEITEEKCPDCDHALGIKEGPYGKYYHCTNVNCGYKKNINPSVQHEPVGRNCPKCGKALLYRLSRKGTKFISCSGYPKCKYAEFIDDPDSPNKRELLEEACPECGKPLVKITFKGRSFIGCTGFNKKDKKHSCKYTRKVEADTPDII